MTSGMQPKAEDIATVSDITGVGYPQAVILLKKWPNPSDAITHFFDDPDGAVRENLSERQWDHTQDNVGPYAEEVGMSRAPTPSNYVDLTEAHQKATIQSQSEDDDIQKAMAASMQDMSGQENGTTIAGQYFGPAQRSHYPASQWALAPVASSREVIEHPPPFGRCRIPGQPAFLRGSSETGYNGPLITIYHSIPLAREALLYPPLQIYSYGHSPDWWRGDSDENLKLLSMQETSARDEHRRRYLAEIQCLIAFLDNTSRAYGSVNALSDLKFYQDYVAKTNCTKPYEAWQRAAMEESPNEPLTQVFTSVGSRTPNPGMPAASIDQQDILQVECTTRTARTITELLDLVLWYDTADSQVENVWFEQLGHIFTMRVYNDQVGATDIGFAPDEVLYLDRYTPEFREASMRMRLKRYALLKQQLNLERAQQRVLHVPAGRDPGLLTNVTEILGMVKELIPVAVDNSLRSTIDDDEIMNRLNACEIQKQIGGLMSQIDSNLTRLDQSRVELEAQIRSIMLDFTDPATSTLPLRYKYHLQGVSTKPNITYLRKRNPDLMNIDGEEEPHETWEWWRTEWGETSEQGIAHLNAHVDGSLDGAVVSEGTNPFSVRKIAAEEVLQAVRDDHHTAMLVYADDVAMNFRPSPLPASLRQFVDQDNRSFEDDLSIHRPQRNGRQRGWSNETNSTIMDDSNPFEDNTYATPYGRDMTPMSTSTIRSLSGQPSPKRSRSSQESMENVALTDEPPPYDSAVVDASSKMVDMKGKKIGYHAEQLLQNVELNEQKAERNS